MENLVPLGTGNSRLMKSNIPSNTTLAQLIQMWNNGTFPYDVGTINPAGISQQGTPLNKDTLLKDATAALYGLTNTAVPDDVLAKLANAAFVENGGLTDVGGNSVGIQIATGSYVGTGKYGASNPNTLSFEFEPKLVVIIGGGPPPSQTFFVKDSHSSRDTNSTSSGGVITVSWETNTVNWYAGNANSQFNSGTYYYFAIG